MESERRSRSDEWKASGDAKAAKQWRRVLQAISTRYKKRGGAVPKIYSSDGRLCVAEGPSVSSQPSLSLWFYFRVPHLNPGGPRGRCRKTVNISVEKTTERIF